MPLPLVRGKHYVYDEDNWNEHQALRDACDRLSARDGRTWFIQYEYGSKQYVDLWRRSERHRTKDRIAKGIQVAEARAIVEYVLVWGVADDDRRRLSQLERAIPMVTDGRFTADEAIEHWLGITSRTD